MGTRIGLDFGTTNSALAAVDPRGDAAPVLAQFAHAGGTTSTFRSILYFDARAREERQSSRPAAVAGPRAIDRYLAGGEGRLMQSLKSYLATKLFQGTNVFGTVYALEELIAILLRNLRAEAEAQFGPLTSPVVMGRPVRFVGDEEGGEELALSRLRAAAKLAGYPEVVFEYEPVGAAYFYERSLDHDELVLIGDFGGGTSDFCLMRVGPGARALTGREKILGTSGVGVAGDAFDARMVDHVVSPRLGLGSHYRSYFDGKLIPVPPWIHARLRRWHHLSFLKSRETMQFLHEMEKTAEDPEAIAALIHVVDLDLGYPLYRSVEQAKLGLSREPRVRFSFRDEPVDIERDVLRGDFEDWIAPEVRAIEQCVDGLLAQTGLAPGEVDRVFLTGGSSLVPVVRRAFAKRFGEEKLRAGNELTSVAIGLSLRAREL